jgi:hypothetical protein
LSKSKQNKNSFKIELIHSGTKDVHDVLADILIEYVNNQLREKVLERKIK